MAAGVKIVNSRGENPGISLAVLRETIGKFVSGIFLLLGYLWAGWDSRKRAWHDHISGTYPIRATGRATQDSEHADARSDKF